MAAVVAHSWRYCRPVKRSMLTDVETLSSCSRFSDSVVGFIGQKTQPTASKYWRNLGDSIEPNLHYVGARARSFVSVCLRTTTQQKSTHTLEPVAGCYTSHLYWHTGLLQTSTWRRLCFLQWASCCRSQHLWGIFLKGGLAKSITLTLTLQICALKIPRSLDLVTA